MSLNDSLLVQDERAWMVFFAARGSEKFQGHLNMTRTEALIELRKNYPDLWIKCGLEETTTTGDHNDD